MVAMATNSNITVPQKYTEKYKNVGYGWDTSHPTTISKRFIILIYHYLHTVSAGKEQVARMLYIALTSTLRHCAHQDDIGNRDFQRIVHHAGRISDAWINFEPDLESYEQEYEKELRKLIREYRREDIAIARDPVFDEDV